MSQCLSKYNIGDVIPIDVMRNEYIKTLDKELSNSEMMSISQDLFNLGLTVYSKDYSLDSLLYNSLSTSKIDEKISLYPEQVKLIESIKNSEALIVSAPTSFGKTFCVFEYIIREQPKNIVMIVPTLALVDEYLKKIIKKYRDVFKFYKTYINFDENTNYDYDNYNIFILTHDKALENNLYNRIEKIDFLVIDEVYKLQKDNDNDRVLILNLAYHFLSKKSKKYVLLAPFINDVADKEKLDKNPILFKTNFSPVVNDIITRTIDKEAVRKQKIKETIDELKDEKTLVYFPTVSEIPKFINEIIVPNYPKIKIKNPYIVEFIKWAKTEIHEEWYLVKAMERGFLIHNGQLPNNGFRMYQLDLYEESKQFNLLFCTSTILEGVNMCAKNIIITKPARKDSTFDAFDFYNLVGRTGRLYKHYLGNAYYIKGPTDPKYDKNMAVKTIKFEATDDSQDFEFHTNEKGNVEEYNEFISMLGITAEEYKENIGSRYKIKTIKKIYNNYLEYKEQLLNELNNMNENETRGRGNLIFILHQIINKEDGKERGYILKLESTIINYLIYKNRLKLKTIINNVIRYYENMSIDYIISSTMRLKSSYVENEFYSMCKIICYFLRCDKVSEKEINIIVSKIISCIDYLYFSDSKCKKILKEIGIYDYDIEKIVEVIGEDKEDITEIIQLLKESQFNNLSYISKYIINRL